MKKIKRVKLANIALAVRGGIEVHAVDDAIE
jgi:hypothetical protein